MAITDVRCGIYTTDGTTLTRAAVSALAASGVADTANTRYEVPLVPATVVLNPGQVYYVAYLVVAGVSAGTLQGWVEATNVVSPVAADGPPPMYTLAGQTALDATEAVSGLTAEWDLVPRVGVIAVGTA